MTDNTDNQMADAKKGPIVKVHPVVYMTIVDAYERRKSKEDRALGTLLGYYEKNAIQASLHKTESHGYPVGSEFFYRMMIRDENNLGR